MIQTENTSTRYKHSKYKDKEQIIYIRNFTNPDDRFCSEPNSSEKDEWTVEN